MKHFCVYIFCAVTLKREGKIPGKQTSLYSQVRLRWLNEILLPSLSLPSHHSSASFVAKEEFCFATIKYSVCCCCCCCAVSAAAAVGRNLRMTSWQLAIIDPPLPPPLQLLLFPSLFKKKILSPFSDSANIVFFPSFSWFQRNLLLASDKFFLHTKIYNPEEEIWNVSKIFLAISKIAGWPLLKVSDTSLSLSEMEEEGKNNGSAYNFLSEWTFS